MTKALAAMLDVPTEEATSVGHLFANIIHHGCDDVTRKNRKIHIQDFLKKFQIQFFGPTVKRVDRPTSFRVQTRGNYLRASH